MVQYQNKSLYLSTSTSTEKQNFKQKSNAYQSKDLHLIPFYIYLLFVNP
jgi:hypothetical protein